MVHSQGDSSRSGGVHGDGFQAIQHYFQQRSCRHCSQPYTPEGIEFIREEPGVMVVRVGCSICGRPLGIALVGMNSTDPSSPLCHHGRPSAGGTNQRKKYPSEWTKKDADRLSANPPISYDDVLSAHEFFSDLGSDWSKLLPKTGKANKST